MRRRHALVLSGLVVLLGIAIALGGAAISQAGPRQVDFTVSADPSPAQVGRHVTFSISVKNTSKQTLTQAKYIGTAAAGMTFDSYISSRPGTCAVDPNNPSSVICQFGHMAKGDVVTASFRFNTPSSGTSTELDSVLFTTEQGGDFGQPSTFYPTIDPLTCTANQQVQGSCVIGLEPQNPDKVKDVFGTGGGSAKTDAVTATNATSTTLTTPATGAFESILISEGSLVAGTCGAGKTAVLATSTVNAPGTFTSPQLTVVIDFNRTLINGSPNLVGCHNGVNLPLGVTTSQGTLIARDFVTNELGVNVIRLTMIADGNGVWGGGH